MKFKKFALGISATIAALLTAMLFAGMASAQTPPAQTVPAGPHPIKLAGTVSSVSSGSLVLATRQGDMTVNVSADTWIIVRKNGAASQGTLSDLVTGKPALVGGMTTSDPKVVDARTIAQGVPANTARAGLGQPGKPGARGRAIAAITTHLASGTVTAINGNTITLKGDKVAQVIVQTAPDTVVLNNGFVSVSSLKVGDSVQVLGQPVRPAAGQKPPTATGTPSTPRTRPQLPASRTLDAWAIRVDNGTTRLMLGHVSAVNGNTLTVKTRDNRTGQTVNIGASTAFKVLTLANRTSSLATGSISDVHVGSNIVLEGTLSADGKSFAAAAVIVLPGRPQQK
jgi:hypothetical protein